MDIELGYTRGFKLHRTDVAEGLMQVLPIVEHLVANKGVGSLLRKAQLRRMPTASEE
jgi:hypothetical protein